MGQYDGYVSGLRPKRVFDADSHEMVPVHLWPEVFGSDIEPYVPMFSAMSLLRDAGENAMVRDDIVGDSREITYDTVWNLKGPDAPSAIDLDRRTDVLDAMGIERQLVYPTMATMGYLFVADPAVGYHLGFDVAVHDVARIGRHLLEIHNRWVGRVTSEHGSRVRAVAVILGETLDDLVRDTEEVLAQGARAVMIPAGLPPAGMSPADRRLDPFWALLAAADTPVLHHVSVERGFLSTTVWAANVPEFRPSNTSSPEFHIEPWRAATISFACESYLAAMVLGGVFERHPTLRFGIGELTAGWVGPFGRRLDDVVTQFPSRFGGFSMLPSERLAANVRVTPFPFEPVDRYVTDYPWVADVLSFASDFPHVEGGRDAVQIFRDRLAPLGDDVMDRFFATNPELLLPA